MYINVNSVRIWFCSLEFAFFDRVFFLCALEKRSFAIRHLTSLNHCVVVLVLTETFLANFLYFAEIFLTIAWGLKENFFIGNLVSTCLNQPKLFQYYCTEPVPLLSTSLLIEVGHKISMKLFALIHDLKIHNCCLSSQV